MRDAAKDGCDGTVGGLTVERDTAIDGCDGDAYGLNRGCKYRYFILKKIGYGLIFEKYREKTIYFWSIVTFEILSRACKHG